MQLQEIAKRCQQGDREAFAQLYTAMRQPLRTVCLGYVHDEDVADDLLHDAFLLIFYQIGKLEDTARAESWMTKLTRRVALLYLRQKRRQHQEPLSACAATTLRSPMVENRAESSLAFQEILAAVDALPEGYRRVFRLFVLGGMTHQEIAALLNIEPHSSSSQLVHAKALLRRWLRQIGFLLLAVSLPLSICLWHRSPIHQPQSSTTVGADLVPARSGSVPALSDPVSPCHSQFRGRHPSLPISAAQTLKQQQYPAERDSSRQTLETAPASGIAGWQGACTYTGDEGQTLEISNPLQRPDLKHNVGNWTLAVTYSGVGNGGKLQLPYADHDTNPMISDSVAHHRMPLTVSLMLNRKLDDHWQVGAGLSYQRMTSDMLSGNTYVMHSQHQVVQYIGLPVNVSWHYPLSRRFSTYFSASVSVSLPLHSTLESIYILDGQAYEPTTERLHPAVQWSAGMGVGLQYNLTPHVGFFAEPGLHYHFKDNNNVKTWNTEHPFALEVPLGLRITF